MSAKRGRKYIYRAIRPDEFDAACELSIDVFDKAILPKDQAGGRDTFVSFIRSDELRRSFEIGETMILGCFMSQKENHQKSLQGDELIGIIGIKERDKRKHISLLFVLQNHMGEGIGSRLIKLALKNEKNITVNASINAKWFYEKQGFIRTSSVVHEQGLKTVPMIRKNTESVSVWLSMLFSCILPLLTAIFVLYLQKIYPFGDKSILIYDLKSQYIDFYNSFHRIFKGELFYSFSRTLGGDNFTLNAYYLFSPFNIVLLFFKKRFMTEGVLFLYLLKTMLTGVSFAFFANKTKLIHSRSREFYILLPAASTAFALCGFASSYALNIFWLDVLIFLPMLTLSIENAIKGKGKAFIIILAIALMVNFYFGYMLIVFAISAYPTYKFALKYHSFKPVFITFKRFLKYISISCMLSAIITLPVFFGLFTTKLSPSNPIYKLFHIVGYREIVYMLELFVIVAATIILLLEIKKTFLKEKVKKKESKIKIRLKQAYIKLNGFNLAIIFLILLAIMLIAIDIEGFFIHIESFSPFFHNTNIVPLFSTITAVVFIIIMKIGSKTNKNTTYFYWLLLFWFMTFLFEPIYLLLHMGQYPLSFPGRYSFIISFLVLLIFIMNINRIDFKLPSLFKQKQARKELSLSRTMLFLSIALVMVIETTINLNLAFKDNEKSYYGFVPQEDYLNFIDKNEKVINRINSEESDFFRLEKTYNRSLNDAFTFGTSGISHYSSMYENEVINTMNLMGLSASAYWVSYNGSTPVIDMIFGIKYILDDGSKSFSYHRDYYKEHYHEENITVYSNNYALPVVLSANERIENCKADTINPFELQNRIFSAITGKSEDLFNEDLDFKTIETVIIDGEDYFESIDYILNISKKGGVFLSIKYQNYPVQVFVNDVFFSEYHNAENGGTVYLGSYEKDTEIKITIKADFGELPELEKIFIAALPYKVMDNLHKEINAGIKSSEITSGRIDGELENLNSAHIFISVPYSIGWRAFADGVEVETYNAADGFLGIKLSDINTQKLRVIYTPAGLFVGIVVSVLGLLVFILFEKKRGNA